jgi:hypothetical protein
LRYASCVIPQTQRTGKGPLSANLDRAVKPASLSKSLNPQLKVFSTLVMEAATARELLK